MSFSKTKFLLDHRLFNKLIDNSDRAKLLRQLLPGRELELDCVELFRRRFLSICRDGVDIVKPIVDLAGVAEAIVDIDINATRVFIPVLLKSTLPRWILLLIQQPRVFWFDLLGDDEDDKQIGLTVAQLFPINEFPVQQRAMPVFSKHLRELGTMTIDSGVWCLVVLWNAVSGKKMTHDIVAGCTRRWLALSLLNKEVLKTTPDMQRRTNAQQDDEDE